MDAESLVHLSELITSDVRSSFQDTQRSFSPLNGYQASRNAQLDGGEAEVRAA